MAPPRGEDLGRIVHTRGPLPPAEVVQYVRLIARALADIHAAGEAHRNVRPETIVLTQDEAGASGLEILDAGADEAGEGAETRKERLLGTPLYLAPEQVRSDAKTGPRTDGYALGHVAYTLLAGEPYWQVEKEEDDAVFHVLARIVAGPFEPASARAARRRGVKLPAAFDAWFTRATAVEPERRFESAAAEAEALADALGGAAGAEPVQRGGNALPIGLTVALVLLSLAVAAVLLRVVRDAPDKLAEVEPDLSMEEPEPSGASPAPAMSASARASASPSAAVSASATASAEASASATVSASASPSAAVSASASATASAAPAPAGVNACAKAFFPADTFAPDASPDFAFLCTETDPRHGAAATKSLVVLGSSKTLSEGKLEWGVLGFYEMPAFAVIRARCCASPPALKLPAMAGNCALAERLDGLTAACTAATDAKDAKVRSAMDAFTKSVTCVQHSEAFADLFVWQDSLLGGEEAAFLKVLARAFATR